MLHERVEDSGLRDSAMLAEAANDKLTPAAPLRAADRRPRTRDALIVAGRELFAARPIDAVSVDDLVSMACVAKGSFYNHFEDKDALLAAVVAEIRSGIEAHVARRNADVLDPAERIVRAICVYAARVMAYPAEGLILLRNDERGASQGLLNDGLMRDLQLGLHSGRLVLPNIEIGLLYVVGVAHSVLLAATRNRNLARTVADAQQLCMLLLRALGLAHPEPEVIAARAADEIIRLHDIDQED